MDREPSGPERPKKLAGQHPAQLEGGPRCKPTKLAGVLRIRDVNYCGSQAGGERQISVREIFAE